MQPDAPAQGRISQILDCALLLICAVVLLRAAVAGSGHLMDDALITLCYAKNIAAGHGPIYNAGEPTYGATSPAHMLLMAALGWLSPERLPLLASLCTALLLIEQNMSLVVRVAHRYLAMAKGAVVAEGRVVNSREGLADLEAHVMV